MFSIADLPFFDPDEEVNYEKLWAEGEVIPNHPRVRMAFLRMQRITIHRHSGQIPSGIRALFSDSELARLAGFLGAAENCYGMEFFKGDLFDSVEPRSDLVGPIAEMMLRVWRRPTKGIEISRRENPVVAPITRTQFIEIPEEVLTSASKYYEVIMQAVDSLVDRGIGNSLIHGDLKADNIVTNGVDIRFIDWECCGLGHPEDDVASLLASMCIYGAKRAIQRSVSNESIDTPSVVLNAQVLQELEMVRNFGRSLISLISREAPDVSFEHIAYAFLLSAICRLQGLLFVPSSNALRIIVSEFIGSLASCKGPEMLRSWLLVDEL